MARETTAPTLVNAEAPDLEAEAQTPQAVDGDTDADGFISQPVSDTNYGKGPFLIGRTDIGTERRVTKADFASLGIEQDTLSFDWKNGFRLPVEGINPEAVKYLTENEYGFSVSDE